MFMDNGAISPRVSIFNLNVTSLDPTRIAHSQSKCPDAIFRFGIIFVEANQNAYPPHPLGLLRSRR
jgi:hypothetical protein